MSVALRRPAMKEQAKERVNAGVPYSCRCNPGGAVRILYYCALLGPQVKRLPPA